MSVTVAAEKSCQIIGEGPAWDPRSRTIVYVDIMKGDVHVFDPASGNDQKVHVGDYVSYIIPRAKGGYVVGLRSQVAALDLTSGKTSTISVLTSDEKVVQNDAKCDATGRLWTGTMGMQAPEILHHSVYGKLYSVESDGTFKEHVDQVRLTNGIAWSPDNTVMYYIDSFGMNVYAFDYDIGTGTISNKRVALKFTEELGMPDGMSSDVNGNLWIACFGASKVQQFNPVTGEELRSVTIPECEQVTSCCFGGENLEDLYVTTAKMAINPQDAEALKEQRLAGSLFKVTGLGTKGMPVGHFAG